MGSPVSEVFAVKEIYRAAEPYGIPSKQVDGMDVLAVREAMDEVVDWVRSGNGPYFVEALTYRFRGHSLADPSEYRHKEEEDYWKARDPIPAFRGLLLSEHQVTEAELEKVDQQVEATVDEAVQFADASPMPELSELYEDVTG